MKGSRNEKLANTSRLSRCTKVIWLKKAIIGKVSMCRVYKMSWEAWCVGEEILRVVDECSWVGGEVGWDDHLFQLGD